MSVATIWDIFPELYDLEHHAWSVYDQSFYLEEAQQYASILELACGTGRVAIPIAQTGVPIVGLDISEKMLALARQKAGDLPNLSLVQGDMESFELNQKFDLIILCYSSIFCLTTTAAQKRMLGQVRRHLKPGGRFVMDIRMLDERLLGKPLSDQTPEEIAVLDVQKLDGSGYKVWDATHHVPNEQMYYLDRTIEVVDSTGRVVGEPRHIHLNGRYLHRFEAEHLFSLCGFEVVSLYGGFNREPFDRTSNRMIWIITPANKGFSKQ